jgi:hypothetical protein
MWAGVMNHEERLGDTILRRRGGGALQLKSRWEAAALRSGHSLVRHLKRAGAGQCVFTREAEATYLNKKD